MTVDLRRALHRKVVSHLDVRNAGIISGNEEAWKSRADAFLRRELDAQPLSPSGRDEIRKGVLEEIFEYGPISPFLADPSVTEVMVNGTGAIYIERAGTLSLTGSTFVSEETLRATIDRIVSGVNRRLDESSPYVDARLPDGSRVNAIIPPVSLAGPCLTVRKFRKEPFSMDELVRLGSLTDEAARYLEDAVVGRMNMIVSGGTGSGKTTLLNAVCRYIPDAERVITIEDAAEIRIPKPHVISLEARPANIEGSGAVTIRELVRNSLRMRPDRIIIGECRGGEALDMLQAMNTGHDGSITTGHANTPRDMLRRLETMVLLSGVDIPVRAIREQISSAIDVIVHTARLGDGRRCVASITEVTGIGEHQVLLQELFRLTRTRAGGTVRGVLEATGIPSKFRGDRKDWE